MAIGDKFKFVIASSSHGDDYYGLRVTEEGWRISHHLINGNCDRQGIPHLIENLKQDDICYPSHLPWIMAEIWEHAVSGGKQSEEIQEMLNKTSSWVRECNRLRKPL